jgi:hypothetical protein
MVPSKANVAKSTGNFPILNRQENKSERGIKRAIKIIERLGETKRI